MIETSTRGSLPRPAALLYGAGVALVGIALSLLGLAVAMGPDPDGSGFGGLTWMLIILPATAIAGCTSILLFDRFAHLGSRWRRVGFFVGNALIVAALPYAILVALYFVKGETG